MFFEFSIDEEYIVVYAYVMGDNFFNIKSELDVYLSVYLNLNLEKKVKRNFVKYTFRKYPEKRISWEDTSTQ